MELIISSENLNKSAITNTGSGLNTSKLVKKPTKVRKPDGGTYIRMQWVDPVTGKPVEDKKGKKHNDVERWSTEGTRQTNDTKIKLYPSTANNRPVLPKSQATKVDKKPLDLEISMEKAIHSGGRKLNRGKLVRKPVTVTREDGSTFTRMQWVDPNKDMPKMKDGAGLNIDPETHKVIPQPTSQEDSMTQDLEMFPKLEATKKKVYDLSTQKGFIEQKIDKLSKEEKQHLIEKYELKWERKDAPNIDWMNAVVALKDYMYNHPELMGAEHLSKTSSGSEDGYSLEDKIKLSLKGLDNEQLYELMKTLGISEEDPRLNKEDKSAPIKHMKNMMALNRFLKENPDQIPTVKEIPGAKATSSVKSTAQKGNNNIDDLMKTLSRNDAYSLMKEHGITDTNPYDDPNNKFADMQHLVNMSKLKKLISTNPEILRKDSEGDPTPAEQDRLDNMNEEQSKDEQIKSLFREMSIKGKKILAKQYVKEGKITWEPSDDPNIDHMRKMTAIKKLVSSDSKEEAYVKEFHRKDKLLNYKMSTKKVEKVLRGLVGLTTKGIDYAKVSEKDTEWSFGISSFCRVDMNDDGEPTFLVVDTGDAGTEWDESEYPMQDVIDFLEGRKEGVQKLKLHEKPIDEIERALNNDFSEYTSAVGEVMKKQVARYWEKSGESMSLKDISKSSSLMTSSTLDKLLKKWGVDVEDGHSEKYIKNTNPWKKIAYADKIQTSKTKPASEYMVYSPMGGVDTFVLTESAKHWTSEEKNEARSELLDDCTYIDDDNFATKEDFARTKEHMKNCLDFIPFDMYSDLMSNMSIKFQCYSLDSMGRRSYDMDDNPILNTGCWYDGRNNEIVLTGSFLRENTDQSALSITPRGSLSLAHCVTHEMGHAIDNFLKGNDGSAFKWSSKYVSDSKYSTAKADSYFGKVKRSNPKNEVIEVKMGNNTYYLHKDEWSSAYEGRIYDTKTITKGEDGRYTYTGTKENPGSEFIGTEHWADSVSKYALAFSSYKDYLEGADSPVSFDDYVNESSEWFEDMNYGDDADHDVDPGVSSYTSDDGDINPGSYEINRQYPHETACYNFSRLRDRDKTIFNAVNHIFNRGDFIDVRGLPKYKDEVEQGNTSRKSLKLEVLL